MAIIFENESTCPLCGQVLNKEKPYFLLPPLIGNVKDPCLFSVTAAYTLSALRRAL